MYFMWHNFHSKDIANGMSTSSTLRSLKCVKQSDGRVLRVLARQDAFEIVLEIWECVRSPKSVSAWIGNRNSNTSNIWMHSSQLCRRRYGRSCANNTNQSCLFGCGSAAINLVTKKFVRRCAGETGISRRSVHHILERERGKVYVRRLLHAVNEDDSDERVQFWEWFEQLRRIYENKALNFLDKRSDVECHPGISLNRCFFKERLLALRTSTWFVSKIGKRNLLSTTWGFRILPSRCQELLCFLYFFFWHYLTRWTLVSSQISNFRSFSTEHFYVVGFSAPRQPPTWRTTVSIFVWVITLDLPGMEDRTSNFAIASRALRISWLRKPHHYVK